VWFLQVTGMQLFAWHLAVFIILIKLSDCVRIWDKGQPFFQCQEECHMFSVMLFLLSQCNETDQTQQLPSLLASYRASVKLTFSGTVRADWSFNLTFWRNSHILCPAESI
jgi:hypothetical protein